MKRFQMRQKHLPVSAMMLVFGALNFMMTACVDSTVDLDDTTSLEPEIGQVDDPIPLTSTDIIDRTNLFFGTGGTAFGYGGGTPAAQHPLGLVVLGPDTNKKGQGASILHTSGYHAKDTDLFGFSHLHFVGTGVADLGNLRVLPTAGAPAPWEAPPWRPFDKTSEHAAPGYYAVSLPEDGLDVELTATPWAGVHRYRATQAGEYTITWDTTASVEQEEGQFGDCETRRVASDALEGHVTFGGSYTGRSRPFTMYFYAEIAVDVQALNLWDQDGPSTASSVSGFPSGAQWTVSLQEGDVVELRVGLGPASLAQARDHVTQIQDKSFEQIREEASAAWTNKLTKITVAGGDETNQEIFYSAMYRLWQMPTQWQGADGMYVSLDGQTNTLGNGELYLTNLSLWDTFRTLNPLYTLIDAPLARSILQSLFIMGRAGGTIPRWPAATSYTRGMVGFSAAHLFADGRLKNIHDVPYEEALDLFLLDVGDQATAQNPSTLSGMQEYQQLGYVPVDTHGHSVATTLEYARAYASLAELAHALGREDDVQFLLVQADAWKNLFHPELRFFRPKRADGSWDDEPSAIAVNMGSGPFTEGSAWQYRFYAMHALDELVAHWHDDANFEQELTLFFEQSEALHDPASLERFIPGPYYWHGNEPDIDAAYVFHAVHRYDKVTQWLRKIQQTVYRTGPEGLPGNDDGGTLSAWYVWNAMGIYPIVGTDAYWLGIPLFPYLKVELDDGATLTIRAPGITADTTQIRQVLLNGEPLVGDRVHHDDLRDAILTFVVYDATP